MSLIKSKRTEQAPAAPQHFPTGYDNPESEFFIPADDRDFYKLEVAQPYDGGWHGVVEQHARYIARQQLWEECDAAYERNKQNRGPSTGAVDRPVPLQDEIVARTNAVLEADYAGILERAQHQRRLIDAAYAGGVARRAREASVAREQAHTCPVCGQYATESRGLVFPRPLIVGDAFAPQPDDVRFLNSCAVCILIARREYVESLASAAGPDFRTPTLRDSVRAAIGL